MLFLFGMSMKYCLIVFVLLAICRVGHTAPLPVACPGERVNYFSTGYRITRSVEWCDTYGDWRFTYGLVSDKYQPTSLKRLPPRKISEPPPPAKRVTGSRKRRH